MQNQELECRLKELELLQSEMNARLERHANSFYYSVTLLAAIIVGTATAFTSTKLPTPIIFCMIVFIPWLTTPLASMFFDDELWRGLTDTYIRKKLVPELNIHLKSISGTSNPVFRSSLGTRLRYFKKEGITNPRLAANTRPILFFLPFIASTIAGIGYPAYKSCHSSLATGYYTVMILGWASDIIPLVLLCDMRTKAYKLWRKIENSNGSF